MHDDIYSTGKYVNIVCVDNDCNKQNCKYFIVMAVSYEE